MIQNKNHEVPEISEAFYLSSTTLYFRGISGLTDGMYSD